jgi:para-aminobenzoate synthetase/4-amino-4-deoxychorismate lyase
MKPFVLLDDQKTGETRYFTRPETVIEASHIHDLPTAFDRIEKAQNSGCYLAGLFSYELGYALEPSLHDRVPKNTGPLLQLGVFKNPPKPAPAHMLYNAKSVSLALDPKWTLEDYLNRFGVIKGYIESGDVYQINLTFPMEGQTKHSLAKIYASFRRAQPGRYGGIVSLGGPDVISFSPELFFEKKGQHMRMRPMKGTRPRKHNTAQDQALREELLNEPKSKAENLMIVDLLRNDLSRLCEAGSVKVPELFHVETYPTVHQMISEVTGTLREDVNWIDIFTGLFPCGSVTGAPKIRAMEIIDDLETQPRGAYCGAVGYIAPDGDACFNVAIRTLQIDSKGNQERSFRYDVGSGVVFDSEGRDEYEECRLKSEIFASSKKGFFETFRWDPNSGYIRLDLHLDRFMKAAVAYKTKIKRSTLSKFLSEHAPHETIPQRVRLSLSDSGALNLRTEDLKPLQRTPAHICVSPYPLRPARQITAHKTENRDFYDGERHRMQARFQVDEVLFQAPDGMMAEGSFTTLFIEENGALLTPYLKHILPGVLRQSLIQNGDAVEAAIPLARLQSADKIFIGNSLRGLVPAKLIETNKSVKSP